MAEEKQIPQKFLNVLGLGKPARMYEHSKLSKAGNVFGALVCTILGIYLVIEGFVFYEQRFPEVADTNKPYIIGFGIIFLLAAGFWAWRLITRWNERLVIYEQGFAYSMGKKEVDVFKWDDISVIGMRVIRHSMYGIPTATQRKYWIQKLSGERLTLDGSLSDPDECIGLIRKGANPFILSRTKEIFEQDQQISFGAIAISKSKGMIKGKKNYPWSDIGRISVNRGTMWVEPKEKGTFRPFNFSVVGMENFDILVAIASEMAEKYR